MTYLSHLAPTLPALCRHHALERPDALAYLWLSATEEEGPRLTFGQLNLRAEALAYRLLHAGLAQRNSTALLLYRPGLDFIVALLACSYARVIAVPTYAGNLQRDLPRLARIAADCKASSILTDSSMAEHIGATFCADPVLGELPLIATDLPDDAAAGGPLPEVSGEDIAFLQYTSGSTGLPKGVQVSQANVLQNQKMIRSAFGHSDRTIFVGWLPFHHDMGLVGNILQPLYLGIQSVLMTPEAFVQKPVRWLRAISRYGATTSGGPNFAYELCVQRVKDAELAALDLSSWEVAFNGAEPVRSETLSAFARKFAACGFRENSFYPCYGMAEATLFVTGGTPQSGARVVTLDAEAQKKNRVVLTPGASAKESRNVVSCGRAWLDERIAIVDPPSGAQCEPQRIGEVWVAGPHVSRGYLNRTKLNSETFDGYLPGGDGPFLRTGDLGFLLDGELFITGRIKDLIIVNGRNHYPHDIEESVARAHPAFRKGGTAAFPVEKDGKGGVALMQELDRRHLRLLQEDGGALRSSMLRAVSRMVAEEHDLAIDGCLFVGEGRVPRTSSGKIRRKACAEMYSGERDMADRGAWADAAAVELQ